MPLFISEILSKYGIYFVICSGVCLVLAGLFLMIAEQQMSRIDVPENADFFTTIQHAPFFVVVAIDLIDLALDVFATPFVWGILGHFGLKGLRNVSVIEAFIPGTQMFPTLTVCWIAVNVLGVRF